MAWTRISVKWHGSSMKRSVAPCDNDNAKPSIAMALSVSLFSIYYVIAKARQRTIGVAKIKRTMAYVYQRGGAAIKRMRMTMGLLLPYILKAGENKRQ